jgi:hypothetical protein
MTKAKKSGSQPFNTVAKVVREKVPGWRLDSMGHLQPDGSRLVRLIEVGSSGKKTGHAGPPKQKTARLKADSTVEETTK